MWPVRQWPVWSWPIRTYTRTIDDSDLITTHVVRSTINPVIIHEVANNTQTLFDDENIKELDVDDSDLHLTDIVQTQILSEQNKVDTCVVEPIVAGQA